VTGKLLTLVPPVKSSSEPDSDVVEMLKDLLERAEQGTINGIAVAVHFSNETSGKSYCGTHSYSVIGQLHSLQNRILTELEE
jgi:hypothetical protein